MFSGGPSLTARLANIQHMPVLIAATVASEKPTDAYLIKDIIRMSYESSQTRAFLHQYLLNQLVTSKNVYVKWKVLKIIEELLQKGHIEFKQNLRKQPEPLNEASRLRTNHTKDGGLMTECARIRDLSNKLLEVLYEDTPEVQQTRYPDPEFRPSSTSATRMEGFGNTASAKAKSSSNASDKLKALFGSSTKSPSTPLVYDENYATMDPVPHNVHAASGAGGYSAGGISHRQDRYLEHGLPEGAPHRSGEAGGGWGTTTTSSPSQPPPPPPPVTVEHTVREHNHLPTAQDHEEINTERERKLVDDITAPGGIKSAPPRGSLNQFLSRCKVLDCLAVVEFLRQKLRDEQAQVVLRTLFVVEALLKSDIPDIFSYLDLVLEELNSLSQSHNTSIKAKSKKILHQLEAEESEQRAASSKPGSEAGSGGIAAVPSGTILDLGESGGNGRELEQQGEEGERQPEEQSSAAMQGLFAGMSLSGQSPSNSSNTASTVARPPHTHEKKVRSPQLVRGQPETRREDGSSVGNLLGLSSSEITISPNHQAAPVAVTEGPVGEVSLMDLGGGDDKDDFDPLLSTEPKLNSLVQNSSQATAAATAAPSTDGIMSQLSGLDLSLTTPSHTSAGATQNGIETGTSGMLHPSTIHPTFVPTHPAPPATSSTVSSGPIPLMTTSHQMGVVMGGATGSAYGATRPAGLVYVPAAAATLPYAAQGTGPQELQMYGTGPGPSIMYMNQPRLGGDARPVQRPQAAKGTMADSSFDFLGKSSKGSAFDFVKEEIDSAKKK